MGLSIRKCVPQLRIICRLELRRKGGCTLELQRGGSSSHIELEKQTLSKQIFAGTSSTMGYREDFTQTVLARFLSFYHTLVHFKL